ncbi:hypothetical protein [Gordonia sp. (in: high G+C Gram-positive bacteria)]|uniref:hypothetical protein n=1 Tax=Gordonia sp. (in: high G+C Gram-positive bacteria) TaxID=84139 RepID=UPI003F95FDD8
MNSSWRRVASGNFPLYRLIVLGVLVSGILQTIYWKVPASVANSAPQAFDVVYAAMQPAGAAVLLAGLYTRRALMSLQLERIGGTALATAGFMYTASVTINNGTVPLTAATWAIFMLSVYLVYRVTREIPREIRGLEVEARRIVEDGGADVQ